MSQQENTEKPQQNVRVVPIFVEGRNEPVVNRDFPDSGAFMPEPPKMPSNIDFGAEIPHHGFRHGSIFDRAKDFPVRGNMRDNIRDFFRDSNSPPARGESPMKNIPVNHMRRQPSPQPQQHRAPTPPRQERQRTVSGSAVPQPRSASQEPVPPPNHGVAPPQPVPKKEPTPPPAKPAPVDPITKIQQIQRDVLDLMVKVEQFDGKGKRDKDYLYLDEMLTQNLLKLDTVDTDGKENVKLARKEAVKCINRCLNVLEAKAEAAEQALKSAPRAASEEKQEQVQQQQPEKQSSKSSVYDNHDIGPEQAAESPPIPAEVAPAASQ